MLELEFNNSEEQITYFADVILPLPVPRLFTYRIPFEHNENIAVGSRVIVEFGKNKVLTAIVSKLHQNPPTEYQAKYILELMDSNPIVTEEQLKLFNWISDYYLCHIGEVVNVAIPSGLKISSESKIQLHPSAEIDEIIFDLSEQLLIEYLKKEETIAQSEVQHIIGKKNIYPLVKSLVNKGAILIYQEVKEKYVPKRLKKVRLQNQHTIDKALELLFAELSSKPKQLNVLLRYLQNVPLLEDPSRNEQGLLKSVLMEGDISTSSFNTLKKNGGIRGVRSNRQPI